MFLIKRALSVVLSSLLAMPTVTWAKSPKSASNPKNAPRRIASSKAVHTALPLVIKDGQAYSVSETVGKYGRVKSRTVSGRGYSEMILDKNDDGFIDVIQVKKGNVTTTASLPYRGQYRQVEVEKKLSKGIYKARLILSGDGRRYHLVDARTFPYGKYGAAVPDKALTDNPEIFDRRLGSDPIDFSKSEDERRQKNLCEISSLQALDNALREAQRRSGKSMAEVIKCQLTKFERALYDQSCFGGGLFPRWNGNSRSQMSDGLARVMASHYDDAQPRNYLQCLDDNGWSEASTRVRQHIWDRFRDMTNALMGQGLTAQDIARLFADTNDCSARSKLQASSGATVDLLRLNQQLNQVSKPAITCGQSHPTRRAEYDNGTIRIFSTGGQICQHTPGARSASPEEAYASTIFHELLHAGGLDDRQESTVLAAEKCCSPLGGTTTSYRAEGCGNLREAALQQLRIERSITSMSAAFPEYTLTQIGVSIPFGKYADPMMKEYEDEVAKVVKANWTPELVARLKACNTRSEAERLSCRETTVAPIRSEIERMTESYFGGSRCQAYENLANGESPVRMASCSTVRTEILNMLRTKNSGAGGSEGLFSISRAHEEGLTGVIIETGLLYSSEEYQTLDARPAPRLAANERAELETRPIPGAAIAGIPQVETEGSREFPEIPAIPTIHRPAFDPDPATNAAAVEAAQQRLARNRETIPDTAERERQANATRSRTNTIEVQELPPARPNPENQQPPLAVAQQQRTPQPPPQQVTRGAPTTPRNYDVDYGLIDTSPSAPQASVSRPVASVPTTNNYRALPAPSVSDGARMLQNTPAPERNLPISGAASSVSRALGTAVNNLASLGSSVAEAQPRLPTPEEMRSRPIVAAQQPARAQVAAAAGQAPDAKAAPLAPTLGLKTQTTVGGFVTGQSNFNPTQTARPVAPDASSRALASAGSRERARDGGPDRTERDRRSAAVSSRSSDGGSSGDGTMDPAERQADEPVRQAPQARSIATAPTSPSGGRRYSDWQSIKDGTEFQSFVSRELMRTPALVRNKRFVDKLKSFGFAVRNIDGSRIGPPPPAPLMEPCSSRQRYVLEGTCR